MSADTPAGAAYLDSSAIVKLVVREPETDALLGFLALGQLQVTSALARVEPTGLARAEPRGASSRFGFEPAHEQVEVAARCLVGAGE
jgi:predicted nucleic acid-binding protein